jgi:hypothetical protein
MRTCRPWGLNLLNVPKPNADPIGLPDLDVLVDGVPDHLDAALRNWLDSSLHMRFNDQDNFRTVLVRLNVSPTKYASGSIWRQTVLNLPQQQLLQAARAAIRHILFSGNEVAELAQLLMLGRSLYRIELDHNREWELVRRVDEATKATFDKAITSAPAAASDHLRRAIMDAYQLNANPTGAYAEAVRAVEAVVCPLVEPKRDGSRTLGTAIGALKQQATAASSKWQMGLPNEADAPAELTKLIGMMELLWQGQRSRHAGSNNTRAQTQAEAELAVTLAVAIVQMINVGILIARP